MTLHNKEILSEVSLTQRLRAYFGGNADNVDELLREILPKLREIAARQTHRERYKSDLSPTELVHEIWVRNLSIASWTIRDQGHFYAIASLAMRRVLTDLARRRLAERRNGGDPIRLGDSLPLAANEKDARQIIEIGTLMDSLEKEFPDCARVVDMHYFAGFTFTEIAESNNLTLRQVRLRWEKAIKWLKQNQNGTSRR